MERDTKSLDIQKRGLHLAKSVYEATKSAPSGERKGLISQMRNIAISIPSNITGGASQKSNKNAEKYFIVARGFLNKLDNHVAVSHSLGMIDTHDYKNLEAQIDSIDTVLSKYISGRKMK